MRHHVLKDTGEVPCLQPSIPVLPDEPILFYAPFMTERHFGLLFENTFPFCNCFREATIALP